MDRASSLGSLSNAAEKGKLKFLLRPRDLSVDDVTMNTRGHHRVGAKRLGIDRCRFLRLLCRPFARTCGVALPYIVVLTAAGDASHHRRSGGNLPRAFSLILFVSHRDIIRLRYVEIDGQLRKVLVIVKMRGGNHSKDIREYVITKNGVSIIEPRTTDYERLITGIPTRTGPREQQDEEAAPEPKAMP